MLHGYFSISAEGQESGCWSQAGQLSNHRSTHFNHGIMVNSSTSPNQLPNLVKVGHSYFTKLF